MYSIYGALPRQIIYKSQLISCECTVLYTVYKYSTYSTIDAIAYSI